MALANSFLSSVNIMCLFFAPRDGDIGGALGGRPERIAGDADKDFMHRHALAGVAGHGISMRQMAEVAVDDPAVIHDDVAAFGESRDRKQRAVA